MQILILKHFPLDLDQILWLLVQGDCFWETINVLEWVLDGILSILEHLYRLHYFRKL